MRGENGLFYGVRVFVAFVAPMMFLGCAHTYESVDSSIDDVRQITYIFKPKSRMPEGLFYLFLELEEYSKSFSFLGSHTRSCTRGMEVVVICS